MPCKYKRKGDNHRSFEFVAAKIGVLEKTVGRATISDAFIPELGCRFRQKPVEAIEVGKQALHVQQYSKGN